MAPPPPTTTTTTISSAPISTETKTETLLRSRSRSLDDQEAAAAADHHQHHDTTSVNSSTEGSTEDGGRVALIVGVTGLVGKELVAALTKQRPRWKVYGIARRRPPADDHDESSYTFISCNLLDRQETMNKLSPAATSSSTSSCSSSSSTTTTTNNSLKDVFITHIFWITWATEFPAESQQSCDQNELMISNVLDALLCSSSLNSSADPLHTNISSMQVVHKQLQHFCLQTGTKHYLSLGDFTTPQPPIRQATLASDGTKYWYVYDEDSPRVEGCKSFYYAQEDAVAKKLHEAREKQRLIMPAPPSSLITTVTPTDQSAARWSVHRPGLLLGCSDRTLYNLLGCLFVYAEICKKLGRGFKFGGTKECWEEVYMDSSDARLVAEQMIWASTNTWSYSNSSSSRRRRSSAAGGVGSAAGEAFNCINGHPFTWKEVWPSIAASLGFSVNIIGGTTTYKNNNNNDNNIIGSTDHVDDDEEAENWLEEGLVYSEKMVDKGWIWEEAVEKYGLRKTKMEDLANWWYLDALFRFPFKLVVSREKVDQLGFTSNYRFLPSIHYWMDQMRRQKIVPSRSI